MSRLTIVEGNSNDKDNVRVLIVKGEKGADGVSPTATVSKENGVATISITDAEGTTSTTVYDGVSPTASVSKTGSVATISITDAEGTTTAEIEDGYSPTITTSKQNGVTTITITDIEGTTTATINDGEVSQADLTAALATKANVSDLAQCVVKGDISIITGNATITASSDTTINVNYPTDFSATNCIPIAFGVKVIENKGFNYYGRYIDAGSLLNNAYDRNINLLTNNIQIMLYNNATSDKTLYYQITLMKVS